MSYTTRTYNTHSEEMYPYVNAVTHMQAGAVARHYGIELFMSLPAYRTVLSTVGGHPCGKGPPDELTKRLPPTTKIIIEINFK